MKFVLFVLGEKGKAVLQFFLENQLQDSIFKVVIGNDNALKNDFSTEIATLCDNSGIQFELRTNSSSQFDQSEHLVAIAAGWRWIILDSFKCLVIIHDSLLPKYRGFNPLVTALINGDQEIGATALLGTEEFDKGPIICQAKTQIVYPIKIKDAIHEMANLYFQLTHKIYDLFSEGNIPVGKTQNEIQASYSLWRDQKDYEINWSESSQYILRMIDAVGDPYLGAKTSLNGETITVNAAEISEDIEISNRCPGKVLFNTNGKPTVVCGSGLITITEAVNSRGESVIPLNHFRSRFGF